MIRLVCLVLALLTPTAGALLGPYWSGEGNVIVSVVGSSPCAEPAYVEVGALPSMIEPSEFVVVAEGACPVTLHFRAVLDEKGWRVVDGANGTIMSGWLRPQDDFETWSFRLNVGPCGGPVICLFPTGLRIEASLLSAIFF